MKKYKWIIDFALTYIILIIAASVIMTGCSIQKRLDKYCPLCPVKIERKDSIIVKIEEIIKEVHIRDTVTVTKYLPNPCAELCDEHGQLKPGFKKEITSDKGTKSTLSVNNGSLVISDNLQGLTVKGTVKDTTVSRHTSTIEQVRASCDKDHRNSFDGLTRWWFYISGAGIILFLLYKRYT